VDGQLAADHAMETDPALGRQLTAARDELSRSLDELRELQ